MRIQSRETIETTQSPNESNSCFGKWWNSLLGDNCSEKSANENVDTVVDDYDVPLCTWCAWTNTKDTLKGDDEEEDVNSDDNLSLSNSYSGSLISVESSTMSYDGTQTTTTPTGRTYSTSSSFDAEDLVWVVCSRRSTVSVHRFVDHRRL